MRRLLLGFSLILITSAVLLISDLNRRVSPTEETRRAWKIFVIEYNNVLDVEEAESGVLSGLKKSGLVEGRDYSISILNAQGDMPTLNTLIDSASSDGADMLITMSTPTLQAAARKFRKPIVFNYLANPIAAGVGQSDTEHMSNITGIYAMAAYEEMTSLVRECLPSVRVLGSIFTPAEVNMVFHKARFEQASGRAGLKLVTVAANTASEVGDAATALCSRQIDAVCQIPGNLSASAFPSILAAARQSRLPVFGFQSAQAHAGAPVVLARDYHGAGEEAAALAARIIRGEEPARIPFKAYVGLKLIVNLKAAKIQNFKVPPAVIDRAAEVIQ